LGQVNDLIDQAIAQARTDSVPEDTYIINDIMTYRNNIIATLEYYDGIFNPVLPAILREDTFSVEFFLN
jgi:hypothetical protein